MAVGFYPGSFDPIHRGHEAVIVAAAGVFDELVVSVGHNRAKPSGLFTPEERMALIAGVVADHPEVRNVTVASFTGLVTAAAREVGATCLVKGLRSPTDLDAEMLQANMNAATGDGITTVFLPGLGDHALVSSRYVREIWAAGGDVTSVVPEVVARHLDKKRAEEADRGEPNGDTT
ncbi:MAG: pantetheine-phosphate adenylyltransferase [Acidimicrobiales bacterium]